jgi:DNA-binding NarL/FixJ family response regulator
MMEKTIKIVLVDNHTLVRAGFRSLLAGYELFHVAGETTFADCLSTIEDCKPDIVLMDIRDADPSLRSTLVLEIMQSSPHIHILILANSAEDKHVMDAFRQGAMGCLLANSQVDELYQSIITLSQGGSYLPPSVGKKLIQGYNHTGREKSQVVPLLSAQQIQVLRFISQGCTNQEIADNLVISKRTVEMHAYKIFKKLKVTNRTQAIQVALRSGLIDVYDWSAALNPVAVGQE